MWSPEKFGILCAFFWNGLSCIFQILSPILLPAQWAYYYSPLCRWRYYTDILLPLPRGLCNHCCWFVCLLATLCKNFQTDLHEIFREGRQWASEQMVKFWWRPGSWIRTQIRIVTLVWRALAEVCTVPVLLVNYCNNICCWMKSSLTTLQWPLLCSQKMKNCRLDILNGTSALTNCWVVRHRISDQQCSNTDADLVTFRVSRRRREMYWGHARLCVCVSAAACLYYCTDPDVTWRSRRGCPLVVHYWADLQSVHWLRCYGNITWTRNVSEYMALHAGTRSMPSILCGCVMIPPTFSAVCYSSWEVSSEMSYGIAEGRTWTCCADWCRSWYRMPRMLALRRWSSCTTVVSTARTRDIFTTENSLTSRSASAQRSTDEKMFGPDRRHDRRPDWQFEGWAHVGQRTSHFGLSFLGLMHYTLDLWPLIWGRYRRHLPCLLWRTCSSNINFLFSSYLGRWHYDVTEALSLPWRV